MSNALREQLFKLSEAERLAVRAIGVVGDRKAL